MGKTAFSRTKSRERLESRPSSATMGAEEQSVDKVPSSRTKSNERLESRPSSAMIYSEQQERYQEALAQALPRRPRSARPSIGPGSTGFGGRARRQAAFGTGSQLACFVNPGSQCPVGRASKYDIRDHRDGTALADFPCYPELR